MSKTKEELNKLKEEIEAVNEKLQELTEEELEMVNGGGYANASPPRRFRHWADDFLR